MKIDMHTHTKGSDGTGTPMQIAGAAVAAKLDGICLTDHHKTYTAESLEVAAACRERGLLVFHGAEYSSGDGHILVYGVNIEDLNLGRYAPMQDVIDEVNKRGGFAAPSHPYKGYKNVIGDGLLKLKGLRAIETANGQNAVREPKVDMLAVDAALKGRKMQLGGSDAHFPENTGICWTEFEDAITCERDLIQALKRGQYAPRTSVNRVRTARDMATSLDSEARGKYAPANAFSKRDCATNKTSLGTWSKPDWTKQ